MYLFNGICLTDNLVNHLHWQIIDYQLFILTAIDYFYNISTDINLKSDTF